MLSLSLFLGLSLLITAIGGVIDWRTGEIPNWITLAPLAAAPLLHFGLPLATGGSFQQAVDAAGASVLGAALCTLLPVLLHRVGGTGGGDVKLLAAIGALLGPLSGIQVELYAFLVAFLLAPVRLALQGKLMPVLRNAATLVINPFLPQHRRREISAEEMSPFRFGPAIFAGTCAVALIHWRLS